MQRLANRVALITGASGGLGRATALRFAQERARLCLADRVSCEGAGAGEGRGRHRNRCGPMSPWLTRGDGGGTG